MSDSVNDMVEKFKQWIINPNNPGQPVLSKSSFGGPADRNYSLQGTEGPKTFLQHEEQRFGINIGWTDKSDRGTEQKVRRWFFAKAGRRHRVFENRGPRVEDLGRHHWSASNHRTAGCDLQYIGGRALDLFRSHGGWRHWMAKQPDVVGPSGEAREGGAKRGDDRGDKVSLEISDTQVDVKHCPPREALPLTAAAPVNAPLLRFIRAHLVSLGVK